MNIEKLSKRVWKMLDGTAFGANNYEYGLPHIWRVQENIEDLLSSPEIDDKMGSMLRVAGYVYDSQRGSAKYANHSVAAMHYLKHLEIEGLDDKDMEAIGYAVKYHSSGLGGRGIDQAEKRCDILLGLLVLADRMDTLGLLDLYRVVLLSQRVTNNMGVFSKLPLCEYKRMFESGKFGQKIALSKFENYAEHLLYNYLTIDQVVSPVEHLLDKKFREAINENKTKMKLLIQWTIELQEQNERFETLWSAYKKRSEDED